MDKLDEEFCNEKEYREFFKKKYPHYGYEFANSAPLDILYYYENITELLGL